MEKYKRFVSGEYFNFIAFAFGIMLAIIMIIALVTSGSKPMDTTELEEHNVKIQLLEQDFSNITSMENVSAKTDENGIIVTFEGVECSLKAHFTKEGILDYSEIIDERLTSNFGACFMLVLMTFVCGACFVFIIQGVLYIPIAIMLFLKGIRYVYCELKKRFSK